MLHTYYREQTKFQHASFLSIFSFPYFFTYITVAEWALQEKPEVQRKKELESAVLRINTKAISNRVNLLKLLLSDIFTVNRYLPLYEVLFCHYGHVPHTTAGKTNPDASSKLLNMVRLQPYFTAAMLHTSFLLLTAATTTKYHWIQRLSKNFITANEILRHL